MAPKYSFNGRANVDITDRTNWKEVFLGIWDRYNVKFYFNHIGIEVTWERSHRLLQIWTGTQAMVEVYHSLKGRSIEYRQLKSREYPNCPQLGVKWEKTTQRNDKKIKEKVKENFDKEALANNKGQGKEGGQHICLQDGNR